MSTQMVWIVRPGKRVRVVESSLPVWLARGWVLEADAAPMAVAVYAPPAPPDEQDAEQDPVPEAEPAARDDGPSMMDGSGGEPTDEE